MSSSSPSSRRNRSNEVSNRKNSIKERHNENEYKDNDEREDGSEFNTRGHGPPKIEGMVSLKVDNITQRTGVNLLKKVFGKFGDLGDIYVPRYPDTFASRGFAFVRYYRKRDAEEAMHAMNGERLDGRILSIQMARYARPNSKSESDKHLSSKRTHYSDFRRNGVNRSYRRSEYNERSFSRRKRSRSRSRDRRKSNARHGRSRSRSRSRSKGRTSKRRTRYRSRSKSRTRSRSRSRSRSQSRNSSKSLSQEKKKSENNNNNSEKNSNLEEEKNSNVSNVKLEENTEQTNSATNIRENRSHSNSR